MDSIAIAAPTEVEDVANERRALEQSQRAERERRIDEYEAAYKLLQERGVKGLEGTAGSAGPKRRRATVSGTRLGVLRAFAEGDSWFDYPAHLLKRGLIPRLEKRLGIPILNLAQAGDETRFMLGVKQRQIITQKLKAGAPDGQPWELLLFSGGGNDIVAEPLALWLNDYRPGLSSNQLLNGPRFASALGLVRAAYEDLIAIRDAHSPGTQLVFHAYDFAIPYGKGICHLGPWLKPAFDLHGFPQDLRASTAVVKLMLEQFAAMLSALAKTPGVAFVNVQGTLDPVTASWHNELHPSSAGFDLVAGKFHQALSVMFPGRVFDWKTA